MLKNNFPFEKPQHLLYKSGKIMKNQKTNLNNQILNQLVLENCLRFGRDPKLNNKKTNSYIFGTREKLDIFKLYELRYLLLKVYPLIHNLFLQARLNAKKKKKFFFSRKFDLQNFAPQLPETLREWQNFQIVKKKFNRSLTKTTKTLLPQILFATTNQNYSEIVSSAAKMCYMPFHINHWLSGSITSGSSYKSDKEKWFFLKDDSNEQIQKWFQKKIFKHKKNIEQQEQQMRKYQFSRKPSLLIIPDVSNNEMILRETNVLGIPVIGLVNSNCKSLIAYPIFANDQSLYSIHFFCHFLSSLITKEIVKTKHKFKNLSKKTISMQFPQALSNMDLFYTRREKKGLRISNSTQNKEYVFKGKYFLEHYVKPRFRIRKKARIRWSIFPRMKKKKEWWAKKTKPNRRVNNIKALILKKTVAEFKKNLLATKKRAKILRFPLKFVPLAYSLPKANRKVKIPNRAQVLAHYLRKASHKTISLENQNRLKKNRMLGQMDLVLKLHKLPFSKIKREIRQPINLPKFRFWNAASNFYYRKPIKLATNTAQGFRFKRFGFRKLMKKFFRKNNRPEQKRWRNLQWKNKKKKRYRHSEYRGFRHTEEFNRYLIKIGTRIDYNKLSEDNLKRKNGGDQSLLYRKRWHSKKIKKK